MMLIGLAAWGMAGVHCGRRLPETLRRPAEVFASKGAPNTLRTVLTAIRLRRVPFRAVA
ncbi:hypothetical protein D3C71_2010410 [compost metagenome]